MVEAPDRSGLAEGRPVAEPVGSMIVEIGGGTSEVAVISLGGIVGFEIRGRDLRTGLPKSVSLTAAEIRGALEVPVGQIVAAVKETLDRTPPELAGDIMDRGITLAGGGSLLAGLDQRLREECQMPCQLAEDPLDCVAIGSGISLEEFETINRSQRKTSGKGRGRLAGARR